MSEENADVPQMYEEAKEEIARLRALIKACEFEGGSRVPGSCPWCGQWKVHADCAAFTPKGEVR